MGKSNEEITLYDSAKKILQQFWGYPDFRPAQKPIVKSILNSGKAIGVLPTGGGKSICYQAPAMVLKGNCLVVSPLIALIDDQVQQLKKRGISAIALHSRLSQAQYFTEVDNIINGKYKFIYVSPEKLISSHLISILPSFNIDLMAVDEAHCISMWGFDFRPAYKQLNEVLAEFPSWRVCALTASATDEVLKDIKKELRLEEAQVAKVSLHRKNLRYAVLRAENVSAKLIDLCHKMKGSGLVYTRSRKQTEELSELLKSAGIEADFYHAGLEIKDRSFKQEMWMKNETQIMVCTNAFGMGIDKPDVRFVFHTAVPENLAYYYQEAGRAGRDGKLSYIGLLLNTNALYRLENFYKTSVIPVEDLKKVYDDLYSFYTIGVGSGKGESFPFDYRKLTNSLKVNPQKLYKILNLLRMHEVLQLTDNFHQMSQFQFTVNASELNKVNIELLNNIILIIQRKYGGVYNHPIDMDERFIAKELTMPLTVIKQALERLMELGFAHYVPAYQNHFIEFLQDRTKVFLGNFETIETYAAMQKNGFLAMKQYCESDELCRNQMIANYFGVPEHLPCGTCDNCKKLKKQDYYVNGFREKAAIIRKVISNAQNKMEVLEFVKEKPILASMLRELMDRKVAIFENNKWIWKAK